MTSKSAALSVNCTPSTSFPTRCSRQRTQPSSCSASMGQSIRINPFLEQLSSWSLDDTCERNWFELFLPEDDRQRLREEFEHVGSRKTERLVSGQIVARCEIVATSDGRSLTSLTNLD